MFSRKELLKAIAECEAGADNYQACEKLATLYTIYAHQYPPDTTLARDPVPSTEPEKLVSTDGSSEFLTAANGKRASEVWKVIDELMSTLYMVNPKMYDAVLRRVKSLI